LDLIVVVNSALREPDEFFDDEDELDRVERVLQALEKTSDPVLLAGSLMSRLARSQAFTEGNKRTALAVAHFVLSANGFDPEAYLPPGDTQIRGHLLRAARGEDVEQEVMATMLRNAEAFAVSRGNPDPRPEIGSSFHDLI
jgi:prophage maintenance system killer protein